MASTRDATGRHSSSRRISAKTSPACSPATSPSRPIDYYVNEKPSSIAPKVTDAAANAVEAAVNENFVKTVSEKVVETTQKVGAEAEEKADARRGQPHRRRSQRQGDRGRNPRDPGRTRRHRGRHADVRRSRRRYSGGASRRCATSAGGHRAIEGTAREGAEHRERVRNGAFQERHRRSVAIVERRCAGPARLGHCERRCRSGRGGHQYGPRHGRGAAGRQPRRS